MPHTQHTRTPSQSFSCHWPTTPSIVPSLLWLCAVIGHTALALLVVSPAVACGGAVQAAGLINPEASAVSSKLQLCFPTMTSPPPSLPTQAQPPQLHFLSPFTACFNVHCNKQWEVSDCRSIHNTVIKCARLCTPDVFWVFQRLMKVWFYYSFFSSSITSTCIYLLWPDS